MPKIRNSSRISLSLYIPLGAQSLQSVILFLGINRITVAATVTVIIFPGIKFQEQENPVWETPFFVLMPLFFFTLEVTTGSSLQILDVDFCGGGDTGSGKAKQ